MGIKLENEPNDQETGDKSQSQKMSSKVLNLDASYPHASNKINENIDMRSSSCDEKPNSKTAFHILSKCRKTGNQNQNSRCRSLSSAPRYNIFWSEQSACAALRHYRQNVAANITGILPSSV